MSEYGAFAFRVLMQVLGSASDVLYTSPPLSRPGESLYFRLPMAGVGEVTLRAVLADSTVDPYVPQAPAPTKACYIELCK